VVTAFAGVIVAEGVIAGDQGARTILQGLTPLQRTVRVTWQGAASPAVDRRSRSLLRALGLPAPTQTTLLDPVRLDGALVQPSAIAPLGRWLIAGRSLGPCTERSCPVVVVGGSPHRRSLHAAGVTLDVVGHAVLRSAAPLGFTPGAPGDPPVLLSGDVAGLDAVAGLSGVYRTVSWLAELPIRRLNSWMLAGVERRLQRAQASLLQSAGPFGFNAPFTGLDAALAEAHSAPGRMLVVSAAALAALAMFVVLAAHGVRGDHRAELDRLRAAGARSGQSLIFVGGEAAWMCACGLTAGAGAAIAVAAALADLAGVPVGGLLGHSLLTPAAGAVLLGAWLGATAIVSIVLVSPGPRPADLIAAAALAALVFGVVHGTRGDDRLGSLMVPAACLLAGVLVFRFTSAALRAAERLTRHGPPLVQLAIVNLARAPTGPALAISFIAVSTGLGGFMLAFHATLLRGAADQAAQQVALDATVGPSADFTTALQLASLSRWQSLADGRVYPVRRTYAGYADNDVTVTVPTLGVPAAALGQLHGWRASDGSASLSRLAGRLKLAGPALKPGPLLPAAARRLSLELSSSTFAATISADLRAPDGSITQVDLGLAQARPKTVSARIPRGPWELEALEVDETTGLQITDGHQNGENTGAATQGSSTVGLGPLEAIDASGRALAPIRLGAWRGVGAATVTGRDGERVRIRFSASGLPGIVRPLAPSDLYRLPVLVDPGTAAAATPRATIALSIDGLPVAAHVIGVLKRFPTVPIGSAGFVIADAAQLASALDAQLPGQGRADELWIETRRPGRLRTALARTPLASLSAVFRSDLQGRLQSGAVARSVLGTLIAAVIVSALLAALGILTAFTGSASDRSVERDLAAQCLGRRELTRELRLRGLLAAVLGVGTGLALALALTGLAVSSVNATLTLTAPDPPLVAVAPWAELAVWCLIALTLLGGAVGLAAGLRSRWSLS
jgi:hypothetical protein